MDFCCQGQNGDQASGRQAVTFTPGCAQQRQAAVAHWFANQFPLLKRDFHRSTFGLFCRGGTAEDGDLFMDSAVALGRWRILFFQRFSAEQQIDALNRATDTDVTFFFPAGRQGQRR